MIVVQQTILTSKWYSRLGILETEWTTVVVVNELGGMKSWDSYCVAVAMKHIDALSLCSGTEDKSKNGISFQLVTFFGLVNSKRESDIMQNIIWWIMCCFKVKAVILLVKTCIILSQFLSHDLKIWDSVVFGLQNNLIMHWFMFWYLNNKRKEFYWGIVSSTFS